MLNISEKKNHILIGVIVSLIILITVDFNGVIEGDTESYLDVAKHGFNSDSIRFRPILYPLFLKLSFLITSENIFSGIVLIQLSFYLIATYVFFYILDNEINFIKLNIKLIGLLVLVSVASPNTIASNSLILPEILPLTFILLITYLASININTISKSFVFGILLIIPALFKPLWLFLVIMPLLNLVWHYKPRGKYLYNIIIPISIAIFLFTIHQSLIRRNISDGNQLASTMDVNLNLAIIRCGIISGTDGTKLFNFLSNNGLADKIRIRKWNNSKEEFEEFTNIKNQIPWKFREDKEYWRKALQNKNNLLTFGFVQLKRVRIFYTTSASNNSIQIGPNFVNYIYQSFYHWVHKLFVFPIFIFLTYRVIRKKEPGLIVVFWFVILISSLILAVLTYQDPQFIRMRIAIEPILLFLTLFGFWRMFTILKSFSKIKYIGKFSRI